MTQSKLVVPYCVFTCRLAFEVLAQCAVSVQLFRDRYGQGEYGNALFQQFQRFLHTGLASDGTLGRIALVHAACLFGEA